MNKSDLIIEGFTECFFYKSKGEVCDSLAKLEDIKYRKKITERLKELVEAYMGTSRASNLFFYLKLLEIER